LSISVIIPVFRSESTLHKLIHELIEYLPNLTDTYEIILIEDDGGDNSWSVIKELTEQQEYIRGIRMLRNFGQHAALLCGIRLAQYDIIVTMDDDLQHPPAELHKLLAELDKGFDVVYGTPEERQHKNSRNFGSFLIRRILSTVIGIEAARYASAYRVFRSQLQLAFEHYRSPTVSIDVLLSWGTTRFSYVFVDHRKREVGTSGYTLTKLINLSLTMITGFSVGFLRLSSYLGFALTAFGILLLIYLIPIRFLLYGLSSVNEVPGFTFLAVIITIFAGAQFFMVGILGEYLARMYYRSMDKPTYVVLEDTYSNTNI